MFLFFSLNPSRINRFMQHYSTNSHDTMKTNGYSKMTNDWNHHENGTSKSSENGNNYLRNRQSAVK